MHVGDYLGRRALYTPDRLAVVDLSSSPPLELTFGEMNHRANRLARWLREEVGVEKGDRVAIVAGDGVVHLDCLYACCKLGAIHTAMSWRAHSRELSDLLRRTTPRAVLFSSAFAEVVGSARADLEATCEAPPRAWLHTDGGGILGSEAVAPIVARGDATPQSCELVTEDDPACILFTGGTTGLPKGALYTHKTINWNTLNTIVHDLRHDDVYLNVFPLFHAGGLFAYTASQVTMGGLTLLVPRFDPEQVLSLIDERRVTVFAAVPTMYQMMAEAAGWAGASLSSLRFCTSGGAPLPLPLIERYAREKGVRFKQGFGMTEFGPGVFALDAADAERKVGSIGRPNFFVDARVVDEAGRPLGPGEVGELLLRGPSATAGYFEGPEAPPLPVLDDEGWLHTGDLVRYDEERYFYVVGRKKEMFISGGENVYPIEIERALHDHPRVKDCAVVGVPDDRWGEVGRAYVVLEPGAERVTGEELRSYLGGRLARFKIPKAVELVEALPLTAMGKVSKRVLRERAVSSS